VNKLKKYIKKPMKQVTADKMAQAQDLSWLRLAVEKERVKGSES
jgi:hypothetical protein